MIENGILLLATSKYEAKAVALLGLGFGLLALDRWSLATLFPEISKDLHLNYQYLGNLTVTLAIAWGFTAIVVGRAADHFGRRKVLLPAVIGFSLMAGFAGLATGFLELYLMVRVSGNGRESCGVLGMRRTDTVI